MKYHRTYELLSAMLQPGTQYLSLLTALDELDDQEGYHLKNVILVILQSPAHDALEKIWALFLMERGDQPPDRILSSYYSLHGTAHRTFLEPPPINPAQLTRSVQETLETADEVGLLSHTTSVLSARSAAEISYRLPQNQATFWYHITPGEDQTNRTTRIMFWNQDPSPMIEALTTAIYRRWRMLFGQPRDLPVQGITYVGLHWAVVDLHFPTPTVPSRPTPLERAEDTVQQAFTEATKSPDLSYYTLQKASWSLRNTHFST